MKNLLPFTTILLAAFLPAYAQIHYPGGVPGVSVWHAASQDSAGHYGWTDLLNQGQSAVPTHAGTKLNAHASAYFDGDKNTFVVPLEKQKGKSASVFIVYQHIKSNGEQTVWSVENETGSALVMTTQRLGDLEQYEYINYTSITEPQYRIFTYTLNDPANTTGEENESLSFKIGRQPSGVPAKNFKGYIPEIILYDRTLNWHERQRIESYLAVKYGISLDQSVPVSYLNSNGHVIWNAQKGSKYNSNITAVGRDDRSGLLQRASTSSLEQGLLQISLTDKESLPDNHFLFWADNGGGLQFIRQKGKWKQTGRQWKISKYGDVQKWAAVQSFDLTHFSNRYLDNGEHYALMIDHSGSGGFSVGNVSFIKAHQEKDRLRFTDIEWHGQEVFALAAVPELFTRCGIDNPSCGQTNGRLQIEINGGTPPYQIEFIPADKPASSVSLTTNNSLYALPEISQGDYLLQVRDAQGISCTETIRVESLETQRIPLASDYIIKQGEGLTLNVPFSEGFYRWQLPDGQVSYSPEIHAGQSGAYYLTVRNGEGCESSKRIDITSFQSNFSRLNCYPNPTLDGYFWLDIGLYQEADAELSLYNAAGSLVSRSRLGGSSYYLYRGYLPQAGFYIIQITCNGTSENLKLIRN